MPDAAVSTTNPCRMCRPMGACLALRGVAGSMVLLHGSQGCSTYMRRYISSHFHEPVDIASSSLSEKSAVYGGAGNLKQGIRNVAAKYSPAVLAVATTCLTETIGDDVPMIIGDLRREHPELGGLEIVPISTPSYTGSHVDGFLDACVAVLSMVAGGGEQTGTINLFPGFVSPADTRHLKEIMADFETPAMILPDISETLDGGISAVYHRIPEGGTPITAITEAGRAAFSVEFNVSAPETQSAARFLESRFAVPAERLPLPVGIRYSDLFFHTLSEMALRPVPEKYEQERSRLLDAMVDAHKYLFGKRAVVYGDPEFVIALTSFLVDTGVFPAVCASGGGNEGFRRRIEKITGGLEEQPVTLIGTDFGEIAAAAERAAPDILIGSSKGNHIARRLGVPLLRLGFPVHDRLGGQRILHIGYRGAMHLLDLLANTFIAKDQEELGYGYSYM